MNETTFKGLVFGVFGTSSHYRELLVAIYDNRGAASEHAAFINGVNNEWTANVEWTKLYSTFSENNVRQWQSMDYLESSQMEEEG